MRITNSTTNCQLGTRHTITNLAKCAKMTEGEHRIIHGMNGVTDSGSNQEDGLQASAIPDTSPTTYNNLGGRLKFFKNGRFILELARAREGEKVAWVPVPKKTFWPPQGSASSLSTYRQESSASLSVSDDNSSVQSSPWQRDHTWKQTSPQRNKSVQCNFYFLNVNRRHAPKPQRNTCWLNRLTRSPYLPITDQIRTKCMPRKNKCNNPKCVNSAIIPSSKNSLAPPVTLMYIVDQLWNKSPQSVNNITSPRKRILRDLERVTIDDLSIYNKRCRGKVNHPNKQSTVTISVPQQITTVVCSTSTPLAVSSITTSTSSSANIHINNNNISNNNNNFSGSNNSNNVNGSSSNNPEEHYNRTATASASNVINPPSTPTITTKNCSYSITSLLGVKSEPSDDKFEQSSSHFKTSTASRITHHDNLAAHSIRSSLKSNHSYGAGADAVDGPCSSVDMLIKKSPPSSPPTHYTPPSHYSPVVAHHHPLPYMSPYAVYPSVLGHHHHAPSYIAPYYGNPTSAAAGYAIRGGPVPPPGFYTPLVSPPISRHDHPPSQPYSTWSTIPANAYDHHCLHRDDSDVPLNLSKHAD